MSDAQRMKDLDAENIMCRRVNAELREQIQGLFFDLKVATDGIAKMRGERDLSRQDAANSHRSGVEWRSEKRKLKAEIERLRTNIGREKAERHAKTWKKLASSLRKRMNLVVDLCEILPPHEKIQLEKRAEAWKALLAESGEVLALLAERDWTQELLIGAEINGMCAKIARALEPALSETETTQGDA